MNIQIDDKQNRNKIAIIVVGYNRLHSIVRLLNSLRNAIYSHQDIPLVISIDCSGNTELYEYVRNFDWPLGDKYVFIQEARLGLKEHIFRCGDLSIYFKAIILLEDDIFVSPYFYYYVCATVDKYDTDNRIAGIALYLNEMNGYVGIPFIPLNNGFDVFAWQDVCTSGECWTFAMWKQFREWLKQSDFDFAKLEMPDQVRHWGNAWSKYFLAYLVSTNRYFVFPYISLSTNFGDIGTHGDENTTIVQVNLLLGSKKYNLPDFDQLIKYDIYQNNKSLGDYLGIDENDLCCDCFGNNPNLYHRKYLLSILSFPYTIIQSFALQMRPIELNIIYQINGKDIFLYDTTKPAKNYIKKKISTEYFIYHLKGFRRDYLLRTAIKHYTIAIKRKLKKKFR